MKKILSLIVLLTITHFAYAQNVGIGITIPLARLHVADSSVVFTSPLPFTNLGNPPISGAGKRMMWYADKAAFRVGWVGGTQWDKNNIGQSSFAIGGNTTASGTYSTAMGDQSIASGEISTAIGQYAQAIGHHSFALGPVTLANSYASLALGSFNDPIIATPSTTWIATDPLLIIGNGFSSYTPRSNALVILKNGNTGIGTNAPIARLHVKDSSVLFSAPGDISGTPENSPISGTGRRMMWYPCKAAFRVGYVNGSQWDQNNIGNYSFAAGRVTTAAGNSATAFGYGTTANGISATALGRETIATGDYSTAAGFGSEANGYISAAMGTYSFATGDYSTAIGNAATASGLNSLAIGENINAKGGNESVLGRWNTDYIPTGAVTDRLFSIGNGTTALARSDAFTVLKNGNTGIGTTTPLTNLHIRNGLAGVNPFPSTFLAVESNTNTYLNLLAPAVNENAILFGHPGNAANGVIMYNNPSTPNGFQFRNNGNQIRMTIANDGNVGIGVNPSARLSISANGTELTGTAASNTFRTLAGTLGSTAGNELNLTSIGFSSTNNSSLGIKAYRNNAGSDWTSTALILSHDVDNSPKINGSYIALAANGNIGIGTTSPSYKLDVNNRMRIRSGGNNGISAGLWLNNNSNVEAAFIGMEDDTHVGFFGSPGGWKFGMNTQTGALKINGSEGTAGQVLQSNGSGAAPTWVGTNNTLYNNTNIVYGTASPAQFFYADEPPALVTGLSYTFSVSGNAKILVSFIVSPWTNSCVGCFATHPAFYLKLDEGALISRYEQAIQGGAATSIQIAASNLLQTGPGTHTIQLWGQNTGFNSFGLSANTSDFANYMVVQVIPQ